MVRNFTAECSSDQIFLAVHYAARALNIPQEEAEKILKTVLQYQEQHSIWPEGFM